MRIAPKVIAFLVILLGVLSRGEAGLLFVESESTMHVVDTSTGSLSYSFSILDSGPMAVADTIRMRSASGNLMTEYSLSGAFLGQSIVGQSSFFGFDGTTDGSNYNYAMPNSAFTTTVYQYDRNWDNEAALFTFSNSPEIFGLGITYDLSNNTLWVANDVFGNDIKNFDLAGNLLSSFSFAGGLGRPGPLAYDSETDTLWFMTESGNTFLQFDKSGQLLTSFVVPGIAQQGYNMEFAAQVIAAVPEPTSFALGIVGAFGVVVGSIRRRRSQTVSVS